MLPTPRRVSKSILSLLRAVGHSTLLASLLASMLLLPGLPLTAQALENDMRYPATLELLGKFGNRRIIGEGRAFIPLWQDPNNLLYLDLRGMGDDQSNAEGNFGAAFRHMFNETWILGGYGFFDYRSSDLGNNSFVGGLLGVEALSTNWDFHANGYFPEGGSKRAPDFDRTVADFPNIAVSRGEERALWGVDSEIGWRLPFSDESLFWDTRVFAGGYYFGNTGVRSIAGPRGRVEIRFHNPFPFLPKGSRITLGGDVQWDQVRDVQGFGSVALRVPIYGYGGTPPDTSTKLSRLQLRMLDPIQRDQDIVTNIKAGRRDPVFNIKTGERIDFLTYTDKLTDGSGTETSPALIDNAIATAGENGIVVALSRTGPIDVNSDNSDPGNIFSANLLDGQILMGGGQIITVLDASGRRFPFRAGGLPGTLVNSSGNGDPIVDAARNNLIHGLQFGGNDFGTGNGTGTEGSPNWIGVRAFDPGASPIPGVFGGLMVTNSTFTDMGLYGIQVLSPSSTEGEPLGDYSWEVGIMDSKFSGFFQPIEINASSEAIRLDISNNHFDSFGFGQAVDIDLDSFIQHVSITGNSFRGYSNGLNLASSSFGTDFLIAGNRIDTDYLGASPRAGEGVAFGNRAISVFANAFDLEGDVLGNEVRGYGQNCGKGCDPAVTIFALAGDRVDLDVSKNDIRLLSEAETQPEPEPEPEPEGGFAAPNIGLAVLAGLGYVESEGSPSPSEGPDLDLRVQGNTVRGYAGRPDAGQQLDTPLGAVSVFANTRSLASAEVDVSGNDITAQKLLVGKGSELGDFGYRGLQVVAGDLMNVAVPEGGGVGGGSLDMDVRTNVVTGFAGLGGNVNLDGAASIQAVVDRARVSVTGNRISAPSLFDPAAGPGLNVLVQADAGLEGESREPDVLVSGNDVTNYTGSNFADFRAGEGLNNLTSAVNVFSLGDLFTEVSNNEITAPEFSDVSLFGTGTGLLALGYAEGDLGDGATLAVLDNRVERYGQLGNVFAEGNEGGNFGSAPAVLVLGGVIDSGDLNVTVARNQITAENDEAALSEIGLFVAAESDQQLDVIVEDNTIVGYAGGFFDNVVLGSAAEGNGQSAAVIVAASGDDTGALDVTVDNNTVTAPDQPTDIGLAVGIFDFATATATVSNNTIAGYAGDFQYGALAVEVDSDNPATVTVENNTVTAPSFELNGAEGMVGLPGIGISVDAFVNDDAPDELLSINVLRNNVDGYFGVGGNENGLFGATPAGITVSALTANGAGDIRVEADDNNVTAPETELLTGPGISIYADAIGGVASGAEGEDANGDVTVIVTENNVTDYSGSFSHAAVEVAADGDEVTVLVGTDEQGANRGNTVTAPSQGGTTGIDVSADGLDVDVQVENNTVIGYGFGVLQQRLGEGEFVPEVFTSVVVTTFAETADVSVSNNTVTRSEDDGQGGIFVGGQTDDTFDVTVSDNGVDGYLGGLGLNGGGEGVVDAFPGAITVDAEAFDEDVTVAVEGNDVTAPGGPSIGLSGPGISIDARNGIDGNVTVSVNENVVEGYTGSSQVAAVNVEANTPDIATVYVGTNQAGDDLGNTIRAPSEGGLLGISVINESEFANTVVHDNTVVGYGTASVPVAEGETESPAIRVQSAGSVSATTVSDNTVTAPSEGGGTGVFAESIADTGTSTLSGNTVIDYSNGINISHDNDDATASVTDNDVRTDSSTGDGISVDANGENSVNVTVENNFVDGSGDDAIDVEPGGNIASSGQVRVVDNRARDSGDDGIEVENNSASTVNATIGGNDVNGSADNGIELSQANAAGQLVVTSDVDGTIENNAVDNSGVADLATFGDVTGTIRVNGNDEMLPLP